jgi:hypothetical protein
LDEVSSVILEMLTLDVLVVFVDSRL